VFPLLAEQGTLAATAARPGGGTGRVVNLQIHFASRNASSALLGRLACSFLSHTCLSLSFYQESNRRHFRKAGLERQ
jgi:hypothetical protein